MSKKILIADDEPDILEIIQFNLEKEGYVVTSAKNGIEAIELAWVNEMSWAARGSRPVAPKPAQG